MKPGSPEAVKEGCTCPVSDNANGQGFEAEGGVAYWMNGDCPLHGMKVWFPWLEAKDESDT